MTDTQFRLINTRNQDLREEMAELRERIDELENADTSIPRGTIAFFDNTVESESASNPCPEGGANKSKLDRVIPQICWSIFYIRMEWF